MMADFKNSFFDNFIKEVVKMIVKKFEKSDGFKCPHHYYHKYPYAKAMCKLAEARGAKTDDTDDGIFCCVINLIIGHVPYDKCPVKKIEKILKKTEGRLWEKLVLKLQN